MEVALFIKLNDITPRMNTLEETVEKLKSLPPNKVEEVALYIDSLSKVPKGRFDDLSGCLSSDEADRLEHAINQSSEQIESGHEGW